MEDEHVVASDISLELLGQETQEEYPLETTVSIVNVYWAASCPLVDNVTIDTHVTTAHQRQINDAQNEKNVEIKPDEDGDLLVRRKRRRLGRTLHNPVPKLAYSLEVYLSTTWQRAGAQLWRTALVLSDYLVYCKERFRDAVVIEMGCGVGLVALVASRFASQMYATDASLEVLHLAHRNVARNDPEGSIIFRIFNWNKMPWRTLTVNRFEMYESIDQKYCWTSRDIAELQQCDYILASDVFYDDDITLMFLYALYELMKFAPRVKALVAFEKRVIFSAVVLSTIALGYDVFRNHICEHIEAQQISPSHENRFCCAKCVSIGPTTGFKFIGSQVDLKCIPLAFQYQRVSTLELWEINGIIYSSSNT